MTENSKSFPDSNVWLYAFSDQDEVRRRQAENLIEENKRQICLSTQVINEVCLNLKRKSSFDEAEISYLISSFYLNHEIVKLNEGILLKASDIKNEIWFSVLGRLDCRFGTRGKR